MHALYILMRTDLPSMNAGKAMAQAAHASNAFIHDYCNPTGLTLVDVVEWVKQTPQGFGTVLVLGVNGRELRIAIEEATRRGLPNGIVNDPTYPYRVNGEIASLLDKSPVVPYEGNKEYTLYRSEDTCGYIFGDSESSEVRSVVDKFKLHP